MEDGDIPPFWQPPATLRRRNRHRSSSPILNSSLLIILLPSIALLFVVFVMIPSIPKILPVLTNNHPPNQKAISVKKGWDLLNITLVIFAILCGIFAKRNDDPSATPNEGERVRSIDGQGLRQHDRIQPSSIDSASTTGSVRRTKTMMHNYSYNNRSSSSIPQWFEYSQQQKITTSPVSTPLPGTGIGRLRRTVSSDPYMKFKDTHNTGNSQFRFFDDLDISRFYPKDEELEPQPAETTTSMADFDKTTVKDIGVDTSELRSRGELRSPTFSPPQTPPRNPPAPPPPPPPPPPAKQRRTFQAIPRREQVPPSPPPPPPPPPPPRGREEKRRSSRKRMNATKEIATAIVHLYSQRKRKRRQKSQKSRNFEDYSPSENRSQFLPPPSPPPPPPPLPPHPQSAFKSWFKKGSKVKKIHSFSSIPTPPPPPRRQKPVTSTGKPPLPARRETGSQSPMNGIPPPPPPPPYKVRSANNSKSGSPEVDGRDDAISSSSEMNGQDGERLSSVTCPSPDLNVKADSFIARHHNGWRLEKLNSWREKLNKAGNGPTF